MPVLILAVCLALVTQPGAWAAQAPATTAEVRVEKEHALERVAVIGASLSEGFGSKVSWQAAFEASVTRPTSCVVNKASSMVFLSPQQFAVPQATAARAQKPTLLLAVDYLFWFGYGTQGFDGQTLATEADRLAMLEKGLAVLEQFECPIVVGDFPDMSAAVGSMLQAAQMPALETLGKLNQRLAEWAKTKPNVVPISLSAWIRDMKARQPIAIGARTYEPEQTARWLSPDQLHPSAEGLAALATSISYELEARKLLTRDEHTADVAATLERAQRAAAEAAAPRRAK